MNGLDSPSFATTFPGNEQQLVVLERGTAKVVLVEPSDASPPPPTPNRFEIVDLTQFGAYVPTGPSDFLGLSGVAFHPWFMNGDEYRWMFVRYHVPAVGGSSNGMQTIVDAFKIKQGLPYAAVSTRTTIYQHLHSGASTNTHYGSQIHFDPNEYNEEGNAARLWIPMPDGAVGAGLSCQCQDPNAPTPANTNPSYLAAQDDSSDLGKLFAVEIDAHPTLSFSAPIRVGKGLRNPYSFSVDRFTGDVWLGDVGSTQPFQGSAKPGEIHVVPGGSLPPGCPTGQGFSCGFGANCFNFGWPFEEGLVGTATNEPSVCHPNHSPGPSPACSSQFVSCPPGTYETPLLAVDNMQGNQGEALIGGLVYRGNGLTGHSGRYFYGHFALSEIISIDPSDAVNITPPFREDHTTELGMDNLSTPATYFDGGALRAICQTWAGEMLVIRVDSAGNLANGTIFRIEAQ